MMTQQYPEVFLTGVLNYGNSVQDKIKAAGDAFSALSYKQSGTSEYIPSHFDQVIYELAHFVGCEPNIDSFLDAAAELCAQFYVNKGRLPFIVGDVYGDCKVLEMGEQQGAFTCEHLMTGRKYRCSMDIFLPCHAA